MKELKGSKNKISDTSGSPELCGNPVSFPGFAGEGLDTLPLPPASFYSSPFFTDRGISAEVAAARPYSQWNTTQELRDYFFGDPKASRPFVRNGSHQSPCGIIIYRSFFGWDSGNEPPFPSYLPELKPTGDKDGLALDGEKFQGIRPSSLRGDRRFYHAHPTVKRSFPPKLPNGQPLPAHLYHAAENMRKHIDRDKFPGDHAGVPNEFVHGHLEDPAKYIFLPGKGVAARIDVHRLAPDFSKVTRIYVSMEGCPKADAILTAILATGETSSVCSVPSVTLWNAGELPYFAGMLARISRTNESLQIVLVPDADGYLNKRVRQQALFFRSYLRAFGLNVVIAAPPIPVEVRSQDDDTVKRWLEEEGAKGVDDFLVNGGKLSELDVLHRELPAAEFGSWMLEQKFKYSSRRYDGILRDRRFLEGLALHGTDEGTFSGSLTSLASVTPGLSRSSAYRSAKALIAEGTLAIDRPLALAEKTWPKIHKKTGKKTGEWFTTSDFLAEDRPVFTIPSALRCPADSFHPLGAPADSASLDAEEPLWRALIHVLPTEGIVLDERRQNSQQLERTVLTLAQTVDLSVSRIGWLRSQVKQTATDEDLAELERAELLAIFDIADRVGRQIGRWPGGFLTSSAAPFLIRRPHF